MNQSARLLTTGQAAKYCSVTPDTILKWIRSGYLPARRTAGGHHRIDERDLVRVLSPSTQSHTTPLKNRRAQAIRYCWEFNGDGEIPEGCRSCAVYQMRAQRCYEVIRAAPEAAHLRLFCSGSCHDCDYFRKVQEQAINVLIVSDDRELTQTLRKEAGKYEFNIACTDCEYDCSAIINDFRPDFAIVDCSLGHQRSGDICHHLKQDPRIPFIKVVLAEKEDRLPTGCEKEIFASIRSPFSIRDIADCLENLPRGSLETDKESADHE
jgi:excisionase family DNA binding protein